jgi:hypothetical protein
MDAASALDTAKVPALQFSEIQASGVALARWPDGYVCTKARSMLILLAAVLLVHFTRRDCRIGFLRVEVVSEPWHSNANP